MRRLVATAELQHLRIRLPHRNPFVRPQLLGALNRVIPARNHVLHQAPANEIFLLLRADLPSEQLQDVGFTS